MATNGSGIKIEVVLKSKLVRRVLILRDDFHEVTKKLYPYASSIFNNFEKVLKPLRDQNMLYKPQFFYRLKLVIVLLFPHFSAVIKLSRSSITAAIAV